MSQKKFVFAGGGSAGHALPSLRVAKLLKDKGAFVAYIGAAQSIEEQLAAEFEVPFYPIPTAKFDRSKRLSFVPAAGVNIRGIRAATAILTEIKPHGIFASGGFASVPVVIGGRLAGTKAIILHACDLSMGLANRICLPFATSLSCTFEEMTEQTPKAFHAGPIVDPALYNAPAKIVRDKPTLLVYGGSQGSVALNSWVTSQLGSLLQAFDVIHVCGKGKTDPAYASIPGYTQLDFVSGFIDILRSADLALCRAGSSSLWELTIARIPHLAVPLPANISRGDQIENCKYFERKGITHWVSQEDLPTTDLVAKLSHINNSRASIIAKMETLVPACPAQDAISQRLLNR